MSSLPLTLVLDDYELTRALVERRVQPEGIELTVVPGTTPQRFQRIIAEQAFDIGELAAGTTVLCRARGYPFHAIPVFPHRRFRFGFIFVHAEAGIIVPKDLEGKRVGLRSWQGTGTLWLSGILQEFYGVNLRAIRWFLQELGEVPLALPQGFSLQFLPKGADIDALLEQGELDAVLAPVTIPSFARGSPKVRRLFPDIRQAEIAFFQRSGIFPITQMIIIRDEILQEHPWVAESLMVAFERAKEVAYERLANPRVIPGAWFMVEQEEERRILGPDPYPYGLEERNRRTLQALIRYCLELGFIERPLAVEELFVPTALQRPPHLVSNGFIEPSGQATI